MIMKIWEAMGENHMDLRKIHLISLKMMCIKTKVEFIMKLIRLDPLEEEKEKILQSKLT